MHVQSEMHVADTQTAFNASGILVVFELSTSATDYHRLPHTATDFLNASVHTCLNAQKLKVAIIMQFTRAANNQSYCTKTMEYETLLCTLMRCSALVKKC